MEQHADAFDLVIFCVYPANALEAYDLLTPLYFPVDADVKVGGGANMKKKKSKKTKREKAKKTDENDNDDNNNNNSGNDSAEDE